ncbi:hypothetical protein [Acuticoccus mangrovi]|uniref:Polysaccharide deacetylase n=1 Tax=Acuticoccus mangrovi TaxID=2796142 RepID=A0A934MLQ4_9HYPH|nr:hypothetical protein [Acuticoccus mangrovi]MBJ3776579.1 hypothetical protein [Acuticoccus mangrovi]
MTLSAPAASAPATSAPATSAPAASGDVEIVWLVDLDPPSEIGGGRAFYPARPGAPEPDEKKVLGRLDAVLSAIREGADGAATVTLHTSPRYRDTFLREPYRSVWDDYRAAGAALALHPHEDRVDGTNLYDDGAHLAELIPGFVARAREAGITFEAFRSGFFAFHPDLPRLLAEAGVALDLSAGPGQHDASRNIDWPVASEAEDYFAPTPLREIPIGWSGEGTDLARDYLFNERAGPDDLRRTWDAVVRRAADGTGPRRVNFLTHAYGLAHPVWRPQALDFIAYAGANGGRVVRVQDLVPTAASTQGHRQ